MKTLRKIAIAMLLAASAAACAPVEEDATPAAAALSSPAATVHSLIKAFNDHDADAMRAYWHDDIRWIEISGDSAEAAARGAAQLHETFAALFESFPDIASRLEDVSVNGRFVTAIDHSTWRDGDVERTQSSIVVYEIVDGKVKQYWYFPPQEDLSS